MHIRDIQESDIPVLVDWLEAFSDGFDYPGKAPIDREAAARFAASFIGTEGRACLIAEDALEKPVACLAFHVLPHPWTGQSVLYKAFWHSAKPGYGIELLHYVRRLAERANISQIVVSSMLPRVNKLLEREGFKSVETNYLLEL